MAGVATGALHVGLAYLSLRVGFPFALDMVLGDWLARAAFTSGPRATALAPLIAGGLAGVFYAAAAGVGRRQAE